MKSFRLRATIVIASVLILVSIALPLHQKSIVSAKERVLHENLFTLRTVIDEYTFDKKKAPQSLQDLVSEGYLRAVPIDPVTGNENWATEIEDSLTIVDRTAPGIANVNSASARKSLSGVPYSQF
jgi:general secretion pathway protein G